MNYRFMHLRPVTVKGATNHGVTVCYTLPKDNGTDKILCAIAGTNRRKEFSPQIIQSIVDSLDLGDFTLKDNPKADAMNILDRSGETERTLKQILLKRLMKHRQHDQFCKKTGREQAVQNYNDGKLCFEITISDMVKKGLTTNVKAISDLPQDVIIDYVQHFAVLYAQLNLPMFSVTKFKNIAPQIGGLFLFKKGDLRM